ncbi:MAG: von Willebrand factor type A domain-containing protein [Planctomycetes bacterium]|nr:von Willebrand factor type A domain-containing protein [Planctomycetota bacterium]
MTTPEIHADDDRLTDYVLGELDEAARQAVEAELAASPELQQELAELRELTSLLRAELATESIPALTDDQRQQLLKQVGATPCPVVATAASGAPVDSARRRRIRRWAMVGAEVALGGAVMLGVANHWFQPGREPSELKYSQRWPALPRLAENDGRVSHRSNVAGITKENQDPTDRFESSAESMPFSTATVKSVDESRLVASSGFQIPPTALQPGNDSAKRYNEAGFRPGQSLQQKSNFENNSNKPPSVGQASEGVHKSDSLARWERAGNRPSTDPFVSDEGKPLATTATHPLSVAGDPVGEGRGLTVAELQKQSRFNRNWRIGSESKESERSESAPGEGYEAPAENAFLMPSQQPLSTFSIDVDSASYANIRRFLTQGQLPPSNAVRLEEMVNYFTYDYPQPKEGEPFSVTADAAPCPWQREHYLARIALQARTIDKAKRPPTNLVFLLDVSGSMQAANKLPLVKQAMTLLAEELNERDRIAIVTYAGDAGVKLESTIGSDQTRIMQSIDALQAGGSTNGAAGINLAYEEALRHFNGEGENRVILCTDGDFNVGVSSDDQLVQLIQQQAKSKVFLSIFGFGMGNLKDAKLEKLADKGNGHYGYIDDLREARRVFNEELVGTLYTVAKDVKIQVEFNPLTVGAYRLLGYENRALAAKDFNDDTKDAGEIGAGHTVTALYEIVPKGKWQKTQAVDHLKYANATDEPAPVELPVRANIPAESADDLFTVKLRYKQPTADTSVKTADYVVDDIAGKNIVPSADFLWAASVASFGLHLKQSPHQGQWELADLYETAQGARGADANGRRREFLDLVQAAQRLQRSVGK